MKQIPLTRNKVAIVDDADYEELSKHRWCFDGKYAARGQWQKNLKKYIMIRMHQILCQTPIGMEVDHLNRNKLDNRRENLRAVKHGTNVRNTNTRKTNTSGQTGAYYNKKDKLWYSMIEIDGTKKYLGIFQNAQEAGKAYEEEVKKVVDYKPCRHGLNPQLCKSFDCRKT